MKKGIVIILAVAIIGAVAWHVHSQNSPHLVSPESTAAGSSKTSGNSGSGSDSSQSSASTSYKDGTYTSPAENSPYGNIQISVVVSSGKITDVNFLQMPQDLGRSSQITSYSEPLLKQETIKNQSANIDFVSGATVTSSGYQQSLQAALDQAAMS